GAPLGAVVAQARHRVDAPAAGRLGIAERLGQCRLELRFTSGKRGKPALALGPVTRWQIEQRLRQTVGLQPRRDLLRLVLVGEQELDRAEAGLRCRLEAV